MPLWPTQWLLLPHPRAWPVTPASAILYLMPPILELVQTHPVRAWLPSLPVATTCPF